MGNDKVKLAKLILIQLEAVNAKTDSVSDLLTLINETLKDAKQLAEQTLEDSKEKAA